MFNTAQTYARSSNLSSLINWHELEPWQRDNEYILTQYRRPSYSLASSLWSVLTLHNETVNAWSHGLGALAWLVSLLVFYAAVISMHELATAADAIAVGIMFASVVVCFVLSTS